MNLQKHVSPHGTVMAVSMMKDEAPYLLEWFAHHMAVGFTDILVYTNDCSDGTDDMLIRLEELGLGYHRRNDIPEGIKPQPSALKYAQAEPKVQEADWVLVFDADEFLSINHPSGTMDGMLDDAVAQGANGIVITWRIFGSGHVVDWSRDPVTEQYLYAAPAHWNLGWGVKTLFKFDPDYWKLGIHRPKIKNRHLKTGFPDEVKWLNGSGVQMEDYFKFRGWRSIRRTIGYNWAQMNHYAVKGIDAYAVRKFRGNVNNKKDKYNADYWSLQDRNEVKDTAILRHSEKRAEIMAELLKDPVLNRLHFAALDRLEARLDEFKQTEAYETLKSSLIEASKVPITDVTAKPPKPRDPAKIAALMSEVEQQVADKPKTERRNPVVAGWDDDFLPAPVHPQARDHIEIVVNHGVKMPVDAAVFGPNALERVAAGKYARRHMRHIATLVDNPDRLLIIGGELGIVGMHAVQMLPQVTVMVNFQRSDLLRFARDIVALNDLEDSARLKLTDGPLCFATDGEDQASGFAAMMADYKPTVLRLCDPTISPTVLANTPLGRLRRVILPEELYKTPEKAAEYAGALAPKGFVRNENWEDRGMIVFDIKPAMTMAPSATAGAADA